MQPFALVNKNPAGTAGEGDKNATHTQRRGGVTNYFIHIIIRIIFISLLILLFILKPSILLNSTQLLSKKIYKF